MKQIVKIEKDPWREDVFYIYHTLPFVTPLTIRHDKEKGALHLREFGKQRVWELKEK